MNYDERLACGVRQLDAVRQFQKLFPDAEHAIVQAKRDFAPGGWRLVHEWISRANMFDRYALWLVIPIEFTPDGLVAALDQPTIYIIEVETIENGRNDDGGPKWKYMFGEIEEDDWKELVDANGDFAALGFDLTADAPVERFATFWRDTCPPPDDPAPVGLALNAPFRFM